MLLSTRQADHLANSLAGTDRQGLAGTSYRSAEGHSNTPDTICRQAWSDEDTTDVSRLTRFSWSIQMPKTRSRFQGFVTRYFESNGCTVEADGDLLVITASPIIQSGREAVPVAGAEQNMGQSCRIGVLTRDAERPPTELDYVIVDDSPVSHVRAGTRIERRDNFVFFGRDILLPGWREYAEQQLTQIEQDSRVRGDNTALPELIELRVARGESSGPYPESPENRALVCGNPEDEVERILLERRRNDVQLLSKMKGTEVGTPFSIPLKLDALTVRDQDLLTAVRAGLLNVTKRELGDDIYLELLRWGYVRLYIDRIGDWNIGGNLDPNQGTIADLLRHLGPRGEFVLGCDKHYAVHFTATDIARKDDLSDGAYPAHFFRTLGERFAEDVSLRLEMVSCDADQSRGSDSWITSRRCTGRPMDCWDHLIWRGWWGIWRL